MSARLKPNQPGAGDAYEYDGLIRSWRAEFKSTGRTKHPFFMTVMVAAKYQMSAFDRASDLLLDLRLSANWATHAVKPCRVLKRANRCDPTPGRTEDAASVVVLGKPRIRTICGRRRI